MALKKGALKYNSSKLLGIAAIVAGAIFLPVLVFFIIVQANHANSLIHLPKSATGLKTFPVIETANLSETQKRLAVILKNEYTTQPAGTKYTEGANEPWCADFVSWVMKESGAPLLNKENGSWRIDDTPPLLEYYQSAGLFEEAGNGYNPKLGDIAIYQKPSPFGNHVNIVVKNDNGTITSVGGNESNTIRVREYTPANDDFFLGYGKLPK